MKRKGTYTGRAKRAICCLVAVLCVLMTVWGCNGDSSSDEDVQVSGLQFFIAPGVDFMPGVTSPVPYFPGYPGVSNEKDIGIGRAYGFWPGTVTAFVDDNVPFSIPGMINSGATPVGYVKFTLEYNPTIVDSPEFRGSTAEFLTASPAVAALYKTAFAQAPTVVSIDEASNPAVVTVEITADSLEPEASGIFNLFNVSFVVKAEAGPGTFAWITFNVIEVKDTSDVPIDLMNPISGGILVETP